jgi:hypothetical protein
MDLLENQGTPLAMDLPIFMYIFPMKMGTIFGSICGQFLAASDPFPQRPW